MANSSTSRFALTRRRFLALVAVTGGGLLTVRRLGCYGDLDWNGQNLGKSNAMIIAAAAETLIPDRPGDLPEDGPNGVEVAANIDHYLSGVSAEMLMEIQGLFALVEHGTLLDGKISRFSRLSPDDRLNVLLNLKGSDGLLNQAFEGLRALLLMGWYQDDRTWASIGYDGPMLKRPAPDPVPGSDASGPYGRWVAPAGTLPRGAS